MSQGIERVPGDGSEVSRVQVGPRVNQLLNAAHRNRFYLQTGSRASGGSQLGHPVNILGNVEIYPNVGNVEILGSPEAHITGGRAMIPLTNPLIREVPRPMFRPMVRLMGQTTVDQRRWGNRSLWQDTPLEKVVPAGLGEPFDLTFDAGDLIAGIDSLGWEWDFKADLLKAYVRTSRGMTTVTIPGTKVKAIFMKAFREAYGMVAPRRFQNKATVGGLFDDIGNFFTKEIPKAVKNVGDGLSSLAKDPGKWIKGAARDIGKVAEDVVNNVISSEVFAGVMGAIAVIPPLTAVGALGVAAYGIAKTAKTVIGVAKSVASSVVPKQRAALAPKVTSKQRAAVAQDDKQRAIALRAKAHSKVVAKIGPKQVPVHVVSRAQPEPTPRVVSAKVEARVTNAVEDLKSSLMRLMQENTPYSRLLLSGMQTV